MSIQASFRLIESDPRDVFTGTHNLTEVVDEVQRREHMSSDVWTPLCAIADICGFEPGKVMRSLCAKSSHALCEEIPKTPKKIPEAVNFLQPYLANDHFAKIIESLITKAEVIPEDLLLELRDLPIKKFLAIFSESARLPLFEQCPSLLHNVVWKTIEDFCSDPRNLDLLMNPIKVRGNPKKPLHMNIVESELEIRITRMYETDTLSRQHHSACAKASKELVSFCCNSQAIYDEICSILRYHWEHTGHPLFCALRWEIGYEVQSEGRIRDNIGKLALSAFMYCDTNQSRHLENIRWDEIVRDVDNIMIMRDPMLRLLMMCKALEDMFSRLVSMEYKRFDERTKLKTFLTILAPAGEYDRMEDVANNIEALYLAIELGPSDKECNNTAEIIAELKAEAAYNSDVAAFVLFVAQHMIESRNAPGLMEALLASTDTEESEEMRMIHEQISALTAECEENDEVEYINALIELLTRMSKTENIVPDVCIAFVMTRWLTRKGLSNPSAELVLPLLVRWGWKERNILMYVLALFKRAASVDSKDAKVVGRWMHVMFKLKYFDGDDSRVLKELIDQVRTAVRQYD